MPANQLPEILRLPLEELCLKIKVYGFGKIADFLSSALSPPSVYRLSSVSSEVHLTLYILLLAIAHFSRLLSGTQR